MLLNRKCVALVLTVQLLLCIVIPIHRVSADPQEGVPLNLDVATVDGNLQIGYDTYEGHYVTLKWDAPASWTSDMSASKYYSLWTSEDDVSYVRYPETIPGEQTSIRINKHGNKSLQPGKIYYAYIVAEHVHTDPVTGAQQKHESLASNKVIFMTKILVDVTTSGPDSISIKWDDVKLGTRRIDYDIYISESNYFGQTTPLNVRQEHIGEGKPVRPVLAENKLIYTRTALRTGTVYYIKIKPIISDARIRFIPDTDVQSGATRIVARILRVSDDFWRLEWNAITSADMDPNQQISYYIKRGDLSQGDNPIEETLGQTRDTKISVRASEEFCYYRIVAFISTQTGDFLEIRSERILAIESEIPAVPTVPDLKDNISGSPAFDYKNSLTPTQAAVAWLTPKTPDGMTDTKIVYDIWIVTDPAQFDNKNTLPVKANYSVPISDYITEALGSQNVIAFKYTFTSLIPNTSYYAKIVAKKTYTRVNQAGLIESVYYTSEPAFKVITTPISESVNVPVAPSKPPFMVKKINGKDVIGTNTVTVTWKNEWYEFWDTADELNPRWVYVDDGQSVDESVYGAVYKHIRYDSKITFQIGYTEYSESIAYSRLNDMPMQITGISNDVHSVDREYTITGLKPNTCYLIWLKAARSIDLVSAASDPIMAVTAAPEHDIGDEKPIVPSFTYSNAGDTYVDLKWNAKSNYEYNLKYSSTDNINSAGNTVTVKFEDLTIDGIYRVTGLMQKTAYYFWIQAASISGSGKRTESDWSDSFAVKTLAFMPPRPPAGFGIKNVPDSIGKNHIIFEWLQEPGMEYILEISIQSDFKTSDIYSGIIASEKKIEGLKPNSRYYAILYAFDISRNVKSTDYAGIIAVNTLKSDDEYDSDINITEPAEDDFIDSRISNRIWTYSVAASNADRFIQSVRISNDIDCIIDLAKTSRTVKSRVIEIPRRVFDEIGAMKKNVVIDFGDGSITVRRGTFDIATNNAALRAIGEHSIRIELKGMKANQFSISSDMSYKSEIINIAVNAVSGSRIFPIDRFERPLLFKLAYSDLNSAQKGDVKGCMYERLSSRWNVCETAMLFDDVTHNGIASFEVPSAGEIALIKLRSNRFTDVVDWELQNAIENVMSQHEMPSIKGDRFRPFDNITFGDAVKLMLDVCDYRYSGDEFTVAAKAGITKHVQELQPNDLCSRQAVIAMIVRVYEIKTGLKAQSTFSLEQYTDSNMIHKDILPMVRFAVENGIVSGITNSLLSPNQPASRRDVMLMLGMVPH